MHPLYLPYTSPAPQEMGDSSPEASRGLCRMPPPCPHSHLTGKLIPRRTGASTPFPLPYLPTKKSCVSRWERTGDVSDCQGRSGVSSLCTSGSRSMDNTCLQYAPHAPSSSTPDAISRFSGGTGTCPPVAVTLRVASFSPSLSDAVLSL